jgi:beta-lactam-binding protein with PASTA domain
LFQRVASGLARLPDWVTIPLFTMVLVTLVMLTVWLYVTRSVGTTTVPDVTGRNIDQARPFLEEREVLYRVRRRSSIQSPEGEIIRQIPPPGTRVKENRPVDLYVSQGPKYVVVPDLAGRSLLEARNYLMRDSGGGDQQGNLSLGTISRVFSEDEPEGNVVAQQPEGGEEAVQGSEIDLLVSKGPWPRRTTIPNVEGITLNEARVTLEEQFLEAGNLRYTYRADSPPSVVLDQFPPPGRLVKRGQSISLTVNLSEPEAPPNKTYYTTIRINPPLEITSKSMRVVMNDQRGARVVFDKTVKPGKQVDFLASVKGKAELMIYWDEDLYQYRTLEVRNQ